jgi:small subunit ribosomal protein S4e
MHQTRKESSTKLPIPRKGTKYVARALSHLDESVPVVIALRDMLKFASTAKEVRKILLSESVKINGKISKDYRDNIKLFNILQVKDKLFRLTIIPIKKFAFEELKNADTRIGKVTNKRLTKNNVIQLNLHDGTNLIGSKEIKVHDSVYLDSKGKISKVISLKEGGNVFIYKGKHMGKSGIAKEISENSILIEFKEGNSAGIRRENIIAI